MSRSHVPLLLSLGTFFLLPAGEGWSQEAAGCLRPTTGPLAKSLHHGPAAEKGEVALYSTPDGRLCETFRADPSSDLPPQSVGQRTANPGRAFLFSALLPGAGQRMLGQGRWVMYMAGEVWAWVQYFDRRQEGRRLQTAYKDLAWLVARRVSSGPRVDGSFEYYESMAQYSASGAYDLRPDEEGVQPEEDPETYNGSIWLLAREIFFLGDPGEPVEPGSEPYDQAIRYYVSRAISPSLAWNWSTNTLQQAEYSELIRASDENLRRGTTMIGLILANHLVSAVDALVTGRLLQERQLEPVFDLALLPGPYHEDVVALTVRIPTR